MKPSERRLVVSAVWALGLGVACSPTGKAISERDAGKPTGGLEERYEEVAHAAALSVASPKGVRAAREAAELSLGLYERDHDPGQIERARQHLAEASRRRRPAGACEAALALARLEARHARDPQDAYLQAYHTVARFGRESMHGECVAKAREILVLLDSVRPPDAVLAPIDADPDADDPSVAERNTGERVEPTAPVRLTGIDVFAGGAEASGESASARVVLRFDGAPLFRRGELAATEDAPRQSFLQFENVALASTVKVPGKVAAGGLSALRAHQDGGELRLLFELEAAARYRLFSMTDPERVVLDVELLRGPEVVRRADAPLLLLDPGHGGEDHGAVGYHGLTEAALTLDIARRVRSWLARIAPGVRVRMTRDSDVLLSLEERAAMANALGASLFVSVHLNASSQPVDRGGVATFVLDVNNDRNVLRLAARENGTATSSVTQLQFLVGSLARAEQVRESRRAARWIQQGTLFGGRRLLPQLNDRGVRSAMFYVLVGAQMPAVLVEASFLSQHDEARQLASEPYRDALAEGIARGALKYLKSRDAGG